MDKGSLIKGEEVLRLLKSTVVDNSPEPDGIYLRLRKAREEIAGDLMKISTSSFATGRVLERG